MQVSGQNNIDLEKERYLAGWAKMMLDIWFEKMDQHWVGVSETNGNIRHSSGDLRRSLQFEVVKQSGGDTVKINHFFNSYGMYLDGGVFPGRGGRGENHISNPNRVPKPWRGLSYFYSKARLQEKMLELTGIDYLVSINRILTQ